MVENNDSIVMIHNNDDWKKEFEQKSSEKETSNTILIIDDLKDEILDPYADKMQKAFSDKMIIAVKSLQEASEILSDKDINVEALVTDGGFLGSREGDRVSGTGKLISTYIRGGGFGEENQDIPITINTATAEKPKIDIAQNIKGGELGYFEKGEAGNIEKTRECACEMATFLKVALGESEKVKTSELPHLVMAVSPDGEITQGNRYETAIERSGKPPKEIHVNETGIIASPSNNIEKGAGRA